MKKTISILLLILTYCLNAQTANYNLDDGFMAQGYDVVAYFSNKVKEGSDNYVTTFEAVRYKFSSQENLNKFKTNTKKYIPQYGGWCGYALGAKNKKVTIDPETFEIRDGKLYLFYNSWGNNTLNSWLESPAVFKAKADENWKNLNKS